METTKSQQEFRNYKAIRPLARGGFGETFLVEDASGKRYVIKRLNPISGNDKDASLDLFNRECDRLREVGHHDCIPTFIEYFEENGMHHIVQQYISGQTLQEEARTRGLYTESEIVELLKECLSILEFIHSHQMIHRDIKPANVIRRTIDNRLCLVDFGAAKTITETVLGKTSHTVIGSASYAAPEQVSGKVNFASDVYGLGATCLFLLTGQLPSDLYSYAEGDWIWQDVCQTSPEFAEVLNQLISQPTSKRYTSASEASKDVNAISGRIAQRKKSAARDLKLQKVRRSKLVRSAGIGMASTALVAALGLGIWKVAPVLEAQLRENQPTSVEQPTSSPSQDSEPTDNVDSSPSIEAKLIETGLPTELAKAVGVAVVLVQVVGGLTAAGSVVGVFVSSSQRGEVNFAPVIVGVGLGVFTIFVIPQMMLFILV